MTYAAPEPRRRRGRKPLISRERIVEAAFELGIEHLTMAAVADRLGVSHQSLYNWVRDRDELVDLMSDQLIEGLHLWEEPDAPGWRSVLCRLADGLRDVSIRNPGFAAAALVRYRTTPAYVRLNERVVLALTGSAFEPVTAQLMYEAVTSAVFGWLTRDEATAGIRMEPDSVAAALDTAATNGSMGQATAAAASAALVVSSDARYRFMIDALLAGLHEPEPATAKPDELLDIRETVRTHAG